MANFAILRTQKLKTVQDVAGSGSHVFRLRETPNADPARKSENKILVGGKSKLLHQVVNSRIENGMNEKAKVRKDSVRAIEFVLTASPEWFEKASKKQFEEWQEANVKWLKKQYRESNVVSAVLHMDEKTPHIHAHVVPITNDGRLSAKELIGGTRHKLKELQTDYAKAMEVFGLERGSEKSIAKHEDVKTYYKAVEKASKAKVKIPKVDKPPMFGGRDEYAEGIRNKFKEALKDAKYWKEECSRLEKNSNSMAVDESEKKRKAIEEELSKVLEEKRRIEEEYQIFKEEKEEEVQQITNKVGEKDNEIQDLINGHRDSIADLKEKTDKEIADTKEKLEEAKARNRDLRRENEALKGRRGYKIKHS